MGAIITLRRYQSQPQDIAELAGKYDHPDSVAFVGSQRKVIGAAGYYAESGTIEYGVTAGGIAPQGKTGDSFINVGRLKNAQPGRLVNVVQFVALDVFQRYVSGTVANGSNYIDDVRINSDQNGTTQAGKVAKQFRSHASTGTQLQAATSAVVHGVGDVCTAVWSLDSATSLSCAVNGRRQAITYLNFGPYDAPEDLSEQNFDLLNRNIRGTHAAGTGVQLLLWARLPIAGLDIESLSADPDQIFRRAPVFVPVSAAGPSIPTLSKVTASNLTETGARIAVDLAF